MQAEKVKVTWTQKQNARLTLGKKRKKMAVAAVIMC